MAQLLGALHVQVNCVVKIEEARKEVARTIPEKRIFNAWSTKRSLFAKLFHGWV